MTEQQIRNQISRCFARLRNQINLSQSSLAKKIGVDQGKLSRMENGEIYSPFDCDKYLDALGTQDAADFKSFLTSNWEFIDVPDFWNPQRESLSYAEEVIYKINNFLNNYKCTSQLQTFLNEGKEQLLYLSNLLCSQNHNIAFLGAIGIGKSTAISHIFNLLISNNKQSIGIGNTILETGGGGTTICEVKIIDANEYGISIIPYSNNNFNNIISDFCKIFWNKYNNINSKNINDDISQSIELIRAIRNMSKLTIQRIGNDKNKTRIDPIKNLVLDSSSEDEFKIKVLNRINIQNRTNTSILFDKDPSKDPTQWIAEKFKEINNGRIDNMPIPQVITLMIPKFNSNFNSEYNHSYNISIIDTKGIDDVIVRSDLDSQIRDKKTIVIFCTRFNDASGKPTKEIIEHIKNDIGILNEEIEKGKFALLVLPHTGEALQVKDDLGNIATDDQEGYNMKNDQINQAISDNIPIYFYNAFSDNPKQILSQIREQINTYRKFYVDQLEALVITMDDAINNSEEINYQQSLKEITKRISLFIKVNKKLVSRKKNIYTDVRSVFYSAHPSTLWASTRRRGFYSNLNICYVIKNSALSDANERFNEWILKFNGEINALKADESLLIAKKYINGIEIFTLELKNKFLEAVSNCGDEVFCEKITSSDIWYKCSSEWGRGPGFKDRVLTHLANWFQENNQLQQELDNLIDKFWNDRVISQIIKWISDQTIDH